MVKTRRRSTNRDRERRIGARIAALRLEQNLSMDRLGERCHPPASGSQINKIEKGLTQLTMDWIYRIADALDVHYLDILEPLPPQEAKLLQFYRGMSEEKATAVIQVAEAMAKGDTGDGATRPAATDEPRRARPFGGRR